MESAGVIYGGYMPFVTQPMIVAVCRLFFLVIIKITSPNNDSGFFYGCGITRDAYSCGVAFSALPASCARKS